jgi:hypothetical protein
MMANYRNSPLSPGTWREIRAIEVKRPCGCIEVLLDKDAIQSRVAPLAAKACYQCQLKARKRAREARNT